MRFTTPLTFLQIMMFESYQIPATAVKCAQAAVHRNAACTARPNFHSRMSSPTPAHEKRRACASRGILLRTKTVSRAQDRRASCPATGHRLRSRRSSSAQSSNPARTRLLTVGASRSRRRNRPVDNDRTRGLNPHHAVTVLPDVRADVIAASNLTFGRSSRQGRRTHARRPRTPCLPPRQ